MYDHWCCIIKGLISVQAQFSHSAVVSCLEFFIQRPGPALSCIHIGMSDVTLRILIRIHSGLNVWNGAFYHSSLVVFFKHSPLAIT